MTKIYSAFVDGRIKPNGKRCKDIDLYVSANKNQTMHYLKNASLKNFCQYYPKQKCSKLMTFSSKYHRFVIPRDVCTVVSRYYLQVSDVK